MSAAEPVQEGAGVVIPMSEPAQDRLVQAASPVEAAAADGLAGNQPFRGVKSVMRR
jgi:hypothetical protein